MAMASPGVLNFWPTLLLFGALQGLFFAGTLLFHGKRRHTSNRLLAFLLFLVSLHLGEYLAIATGFFHEAPALIGTTLPIIFLIGPLYYLYAVALLQADFHVGVKSALHFVPAILCYLLLLPFYAQPAAAKAGFLAGVLAEGYVVFPLDQFILMALSTVGMPGADSPTNRRSISGGR